MSLWPVDHESTVTAPVSADATSELLHRVIDLGVRFKLQPDIFRDRLPPERIRDLLVSELPREPSALDAVLESFEQTVLPLCKNEAAIRQLRAARRPRATAWDNAR